MLKIVFLNNGLKGWTKMGLMEYLENHKKIYIYGTGPVAIELNKLMQMNGYTNEAYIVSDGYRKEQYFEGKRVYELTEIKKGEFGIIVAVSDKYVCDVNNNLKKKGLTDYYILGKKKKIYWKTDKTKKTKNGLCPYCNGTSKRMLKGKDYNRFFSSPTIRELDETFYLYRCVKCGLSSIVNPPTDLSIYYPETYYGNVTIEDIKENAEYEKIKLVSEYKKQGKLLEIGPAMGLFCYAAKQEQYEVHAIEMERKCVDFLNNVLEIEATMSDHPEHVLKERLKEYDVICLWHSLEHMNEPWEVLNGCINALSDDGVMIVAVPNPEAFLIKIMGRYWAHWDMPRHLYHFPQDWIKQYCEKNGAKVIASISDTEINNFWNRFAWGKFFEFWSGGKSGMFEKGLKFKFFRKQEEKPGSGSTYIAVIKKTVEM